MCSTLIFLQLCHVTSKFIINNGSFRRVGKSLVCVTSLDNDGHSCVLALLKLSYSAEYSPSSGLVLPKLPLKENYHRFDWSPSTQRETKRLQGKEESEFSHSVTGERHFEIMIFFLLQQVDAGCVKSLVFLLRGWKLQTNMVIMIFTLIEIRSKFAMNACKLPAMAKIETHEIRTMCFYLVCIRLTSTYSTYFSTVLSQLSELKNFYFSSWCYWISAMENFGGFSTWMWVSSIFFVWILRYMSNN